jgi:hypothetical protein
MTLPSVATPSLLSTIRKYPRLPNNTWYLLAATALSTLNRPDEIPKVFSHALEFGGGAKDQKPTEDEQLQIARRTREALVKSAAIIGLPKTINALFSLKKATPKHLLDAPSGYSPTNRSADMYHTPVSQILERGQKFWDQVYGKVRGQVMSNMEQSGTEDLGLLAKLEYGYVLSPTGVLNAPDTSYGRFFPHDLQLNTRMRVARDTDETGSDSGKSDTSRCQSSVCAPTQIINTY